MHSKPCAAWLFEPDSGRMGCIICALTEKMRMKEKQRSTPVELSLFSDEEMSATQHPSRQSPEPVSQTATAEPDGRFDALFSSWHSLSSGAASTSMRPTRPTSRAKAGIR